MLRRLCDEQGILLILDEIYTGFGRTGHWFACESEKVIPDVICLGKALTGGFPLSACVGKSEVMNRAWPEATGEAVHTSTFLGHPVGCAMALAHMTEIRSRRLVVASRQKGNWLMDKLRALVIDPSLVSSVRGRGLMVGMELRKANGVPAEKEVIGLVKRMLKRGFIMLPEGEHGNVLSFTPPLSIPKASLQRCVKILQEELGAGAGS
jgi:4-aminobutyrate aminotransferase-like enzyme